MDGQMQTSASGTKPSLWDMIFSPEKQFIRMKENPVIWVPLILITLFSTLLSAAMAYFMANDPQMIEQMMQGQTDGVAIDQGILKVILIVGGGVGGFISAPFSALIGAAITLLFVMLFQGEATYRQLFSFHVHLYVLSLLSLIVNLLVYITFGGDLNVRATSLASLVEAEGVLKGLLLTFDVFIIWSTILLANGLTVIANLSRGKAWTIALIHFVFGALLLVITSMFENMGV